MKIFASLVVACSFSFIRAQDVFGDGSHAYILLPAEALSSGVVSQAEFSKSGRYVTYRREAIANFESDLLGAPVKKQYDWFRYDRTTKVNQKLAVPSETKEIISLGDEQSVFFFADNPAGIQGFLNLKSGVVTKTNLDPSAITYMGEDANAPYFVIRVNEKTIALLNPTGTTINISVPSNLHVFRPVRSDSGSITFVGVIETNSGKYGHLIYERSNNSAIFVEKAFEDIQVDLNPYHHEQKFLMDWIGEIQYVKTNEAVLSQKPEIPVKAKLSTSRTYARFSPNSDCVAFLVSGALLLREIKPINQDMAKKLVAQEAKQKAIYDSKQAALSLIMYASDIDDVLPGAEGWEAKVNPYCMDMDLLKRFNYTFRGGNMANIENPASTELGYILGPGGRAVAYCDGHVKWVPNP